MRHNFATNSTLAGKKRESTQQLNTSTFSRKELAKHGDMVSAKNSSKNIKMAYKPNLAEIQQKVHSRSRKLKDDAKFFTGS
jgi:hypothetical protein